MTGLDYFMNLFQPYSQGVRVYQSVIQIVPATDQGQLPLSGTLMEWTTNPIPGRFRVALELDDIGDLTIPAGTSGVAAVYTGRARSIRALRRRSSPTSRRASSS